MTATLVVKGSPQSMATSPAKKEFEDHLVNDSRMGGSFLLQKEAEHLQHILSAQSTLPERVPEHTRILDKSN